MPDLIEWLRNPRRWLRAGLIVSVYLLDFLLLDFITRQFEELPGIVAWYPPAGLTYALLLVFGVRFTPAVTLSLFLSSLFIYHMPQPIPALLLWAVFNSLFYGVAAAFLSQKIRIDLQLRKLRDVTWFICTTLVISALLAVLTVSSSALSSDLPRSEVWRAMFHWWVGEAVGVLTITPILLIYIIPGLTRLAQGSLPRWPPRGSFPRLRLTVAGQVVSLAFTFYWVFGAPIPEEYRPQYFLTLPLLWIALQHGLKGVSAAILVLNFGVVLAPWWFRFDLARLDELQLVIIVNAIVCLLMGVAVTERKQTEAKLRQSEERFRQVTDVAGEWIWEVDEQGLFQYVSPAVENIMGYSPADLVGKKYFYDLFAPGTREGLKAAALEVFARRAPVLGFVNENISKDGRIVTLETNGVPILDRQGQFTGYRGANTDISSRKLAEEQLKANHLELQRLLAEAEAARIVLLSVVEDQRLAETRLSQLNVHLEQRVRERTVQLEAANKELEAFSYSVSHDLRGPLRGIDGWSQALAEDYGAQLDETGRQYLDRVRKETQRMGLLIDDLLRLARVTQMEMRHSPVNLSDLAQAITARLREEDPRRTVEFAIQPGLTVAGDPNLLEIMLTNLLSNAYKFSGKHPQPRIEFGEIVQEDRPAYFVRDNGAGFDMAYAGKLFGPFQRMHKQSEFPGTGIGLATVQRIILRHGGRVWAESHPGQGATFYFTMKS